MAAYREKPIERLYWTIGLIAKRYNIAASKIRFWCDQFEIEPARDRKGNRRFTVEVLEEIHLVYILVEKLSFTLPGAHAIVQVWRRHTHESDHILLKVKDLYELIFEEPFPNNPLSHDDKTAAGG
jgi:DNA-binding transcriptional MerR regulator